ncbi:hypothetical protein [Quisquiliibacterium transsilvanicum]|uniref:Uncharacterized protein n=1 Tax=Quisquiliibacterium transsilvanicum TaxID=1549638 RepID=A0A7W8HGF1_9BURK|nr:hypothetical protein [Quisquiliibacterium transsilvanicum]MBB5271372.1 hypothetical protein [Quisquiliibacterium transsilvanicum]
MLDDRSKMRDGDMSLLDRIDVALRRVTSGEGQMRVPVEATDPDVVLHDCKREIARLLAEVERLRAELAEARTPTMFWDAGAGSEGYVGFTLQEAVEDACDSMSRVDDPYELEVSCARTLPSIRVRAWIDDKDNLQWDESEDDAMRKEGDDAAS